VFTRLSFLTRCYFPYTVSGGAAGQLEYAVSKSAAGAFNPAATMGYNDQSEFQDSRAEAKRAAAERMQLLRQVRTCVLVYDEGLLADTFAMYAVAESSGQDVWRVRHN
jgi:hypothetical protein